MKKEYAIWGIPPEKENDLLGETLLINRVMTEKELNRVIGECKKLGATKIRTQIINLSENPMDLFKKSVNV